MASCARKADGEQKKAPSAESELVLRQAEQCASQGQANQAFALAISLTDTSKYEMLPSQLCRQALVLYRISNDGEDAERLVASLNCYERALNLDADSVDAFLATLDAEDQFDMGFIHNLNMSLNHPQDYSEYEQADTLTYEF